MKPSHERTPRTQAEGIWMADADPFDWTCEPRAMKPALIWIATVLAIAMLALVYVR